MSDNTKPLRSKSSKAPLSSTSISKGGSRTGGKIAESSNSNVIEEEAVSRSRTSHHSSIVRADLICSAG